jgi:hypothetical protein
MVLRRGSAHVLSRTPKHNVPWVAKLCQTYHTTRGRLKSALAKYGSPCKRANMVARRRQTMHISDASRRPLVTRL